MATMKKYPTKAYVRGIISDDKLAELVRDIPDYNRTETLASYSGLLTPDVLEAWAEFSRALQDAYPMEKLTVQRDFKVTRDLTNSELEDVALTNLQQDAYYHPENYLTITTTEINEN